MEIETNRLILRKHELRDFDRFWEMITDPVAKQYTGGVTKLSYSKRLELFREDCAAPFSNQSTEFAVIEKESGKYLGYCGFRVSDDVDGNEFLYGYCRDCWGQGYGLEAGCAVLRYLFRALDHPCYIAAVDVENTASVRILKKLGFKQSGQILIDGLKAVDRYIIHKADFLEE